MNHLICMHCSQRDGATNCGSLFCHSCRDELSPEAKDIAIDAYLHRMGLLQASLDAWEQAA